MDNSFLNIRVTNLEGEVTELQKRLTKMEGRTKVLETPEDPWYNMQTMTDEEKQQIHERKKTT